MAALSRRMLLHRPRGEGTPAQAARHSRAITTRSRPSPESVCARGAPARADPGHAERLGERCSKSANSKLDHRDTDAERCRAPRNRNRRHARSADQAHIRVACWTISSTVRRPAMPPMSAVGFRPQRRPCIVSAVQKDRAPMSMCRPRRWQSAAHPFPTGRPFQHSGAPGARSGIEVASDDKRITQLFGGGEEPRISGLRL
jgi:hypothetical protein